ncbi:MAG: hypothetical protein B6229_04910 [Spirochaetaceae bacterium 4572_7]|nr:MAG: hypothetical protein B6229_04910 [Spirochaetaceae bacterium 4572_7]
MGFTHVYTGDGKGKTTAAIGLIIRAIGSGMSVYLGQFFKDNDQSEVIALEKLKVTLDRDQMLTIKQFGTAKGLNKTIEGGDILAAIRGFEDIRKALKSGLYDMVVADEINVIVNLGIIDEIDILKVMDKNKEAEFVLTGRCATPAIIDKANLVSEIKKIKHYRDEGLVPRIGIEK